MVYPHDVFVVEPRGRLRLVAEALAGIGVVGLVGREYFDGDRSAELGVSGAENYSHAAAADKFAQFEMSDHVAGPQLAVEQPQR